MASTLKGKAAAAAKSLRSGANNRVANASKDIPMLGIAKNEDSKAVMECWFQNQSNVEEVETKLGSDSPKTLQSRLDEWYPIVFGNLSRAGMVKPPFPGKHAILIALEDLDENNGLFNWTGGPDRLAQGEWIQISEDTEYRSKGRGGGLALLLVFKYSA